jgi:hypothetical protein
MQSRSGVGVSAAVHEDTEQIDRACMRRSRTVEYTRVRLWPKFSEVVCCFDILILEAYGLVGYLTGFATFLGLRLGLLKRGHAPVVET